MKLIRLENEWIQVNVETVFKLIQWISVTKCNHKQLYNSMKNIAVAHFLHSPGTYNSQGYYLIRCWPSHFSDEKCFDIGRIIKLKEYVAVSIDICPWQNPMRLGIKLKVTPCDTLGCIR